MNNNNLANYAKIVGKTKIDKIYAVIDGGSDDFFRGMVVDGAAECQPSAQGYFGYLCPRVAQSSVFHARVLSSPK